jgi:hypothetical protein
MWGIGGATNEWPPRTPFLCQDPLLGGDYAVRPVAAACVLRRFAPIWSG